MTFIKIYLCRNKLKDESFTKRFGFLVEGLKVDRLFNKEKNANKNVIFTFPGFLLYRLCYSMLPAIFYNLPGI